MRWLWDLAYHQFRHCPHSPCEGCAGRGSVKYGDGSWASCPTCGGEGMLCPLRARWDRKSMERYERKLVRKYGAMFEPQRKGARRGI